MSFAFAQQEEHHRKRSFSEELRMFVERYRLKWHKEDEAVENGFIRSGPLDHPVSAGVNERNGPVVLGSAEEFRHAPAPPALSLR